jgi:hypothetical protein
MPVPAKKMKALVDKESRKKPHDEDEEDEHHAHPHDDEDDTDEADVAKYVKEEGDRVNDGKHDPQLKKLMRGFNPDKNPPSWVRNESKWDRAKEAVDPEGEGAEKYDEPYAVVAHVYKRMGGKIGKQK